MQGLQEKRRIESEKSKEDERLRLEKQAERDAKTAHWITLGDRPLAEPPCLAEPWTTILRQEYSDARLSALFPDDPERRSRAKDLWGEVLALQNIMA